MINDFSLLNGPEIKRHKKFSQHKNAEKVLFCLSSLFGSSPCGRL
jgi:hypothetical protein